MKVAQLLSTIPEALPPEYARELAQLQSAAPAMGPAFAKRRMQAELGPDWQARFQSFETTAAASASLGQVHKAVAHDGRLLAVKLQYPDMPSAVEADLDAAQGRVRHPRAHEPGGRDRRDPEGDLRAAARGARLRAWRRATPSSTARSSPTTTRIRVPEVLPELSTKRLLTMTWLEGRKLLDYKPAPLEDRNAIARAMFRAWWFPFSHYGVIHGDPHLGNYTVFERDGRPAGINLLDYGCIRAFHVPFVQGVIDLYTGLLTGNRDLVVHAYETWGFRGLSNELIEAMNIWAQFIYGPLLDDRERAIAEGTTPGEYGRTRGLQRAQDPAREGAGDGAARVRVHGPRRDRARRRVPAPGRAPELVPPVQRDDRRLPARRGGRAPARSLRRGRRAAARGA